MTCHWTCKLLILFAVPIFLAASHAEESETTADDDGLDVRRESVPSEERALSVEPLGDFMTRFALKSGTSSLGEDVESEETSAPDDLRYRIRFGLETSALTVAPRLSARFFFVPQVVGLFATGPTTPEAGIALYEGKVELRNSHALLELGRFEMHYGDGLVVGESPHELEGRTFDGIRAKVPLRRGVALDLFFTQVKEGEFLTTESVDPLAGDQFFAGAYASMTRPSARLLDLYLLSLLSPGYYEADGTPHVTGMEVTVGSRAKAQLTPWLDASAEAGLQWDLIRYLASQDQSLAYQVDATMSSLIPWHRGLRFTVEAFYVSGGREGSPVGEWSPLFPDNYTHLGLMDVLEERLNLAGTSLRLTFRPLPRFEVEGQAHHIRQAVSRDGAAGYGNEWDGVLSWQVGEGLQLRAVTGVFRGEDGNLLKEGTLEVRAWF